MAAVSFVRPRSEPARGRVLTFDEFRARPHLAGLDGLRAIAILFVIFHHVTRYAGDPLYALCQNGRYGVSLFFLVSGFLICTLFLREERQRGAISLRSFYARRAIRLFPLYYLMLGVQAAAVFGTHLYEPSSVVLFAEKLPAYVFYYSNLLPTATDGPFFFAWSLAVEEQFYLWFGLAIVFLPHRALAWLVGGALAVKLACYNLFGPLDAQSGVYRVLFSYREPLLVGVLLGFLLNQPRAYQQVVTALARPGVAPALGILCVAFVTVHPMTSATDWDGVLLLAAMTLLVAAVVGRDRIPFLSHPLVVHYGVVSYGIYLMHAFVIAVAERVLPAGTLLLQFAVVVVGTGVAASIAYACFERPIMDYFRGRRARSQATVDSGANALGKRTGALAPGGAAV